MMANVVLIRKGNRGADLDCRDVRDELLVLLIDDRAVRRVCGLGAIFLRINNSIGNKAAPTVLHGHGESAGLELRAGCPHRKEKEERA